MDALEMYARLVCVLRDVSYFSLGSLSPERKIATVRKNILLPYGYFGSPNMMLPFARELEHLGYHVIVPDLGFAVGNIDCLAEAFAALLVPDIDRAKSRGDHLQIVVIGYSMGGLIAARARMLYPVLCEVPLITLATPFCGSRRARYLPWSYIAPKSAARMMWPDSAWLKELREHIRKHPKHIYRVIAERDTIVHEGDDLPMLPPHIAKRVGHVALIYKPPIKLLCHIIEAALIEAGA